MELFLNKFITFFQFYVRVSLGHGGRLNGIRDNYTHKLTILFWLFLVLLRRCRAHTSTHIFTDKHTINSQKKVNHIFVFISCFLFMFYMKDFVEVNIPYTSLIKLFCFLCVLFYALNIWLLGKNEQKSSHSHSLPNTQLLI